MTAGTADGNGDYPPETFNGKVQSRLHAFANAREAFVKPHEDTAAS
jgi:hypothetical protein